jgi:hypothetical protein
LPLAIADISVTANNAAPSSRPTTGKNTDTMAISRPRRIWTNGKSRKKSTIARHLAAAALDILGGIDVLIDNAGSQRRVPDGVLAMTDDDWASDISANLLSAVRLDRELLPT